jgi:hypothetical protein
LEPFDQALRRERTAEESLADTEAELHIEGKDLRTDEWSWQDRFTRWLESRFSRSVRDPS